MQCVDLSGYDNTYLNAVTSDNTTYPVGSAFITSGDIQYVKPSLGNFYQFIYGDSLMYIGDIDIDVSSSTCTNKTLTYKTLYNEGMMVDGDTIFYFSTIPTSYNGNGFTFEYDGINTFTVTGDFDVVSLFSSTNFLFGVCLDCSSSSINCVELAPYSEAYLNDVSWDDVTYPVGSAFITDGYIQYVKPSTGNFYQFIQGDTLMYIGDIDIDVSTANCTNKILTFTSVYNLGMAIDGDTIFSMPPIPTFYAGNGFTFEYDGASNFTVTGDFDVVSIFSSTNFLFDVCLECTSASSINCVELAPYSEAYLNDVSWDDVTYPVGSAFITDGYIQYVKPSTGNFYQFIQGDTLMYIGDIDIDVSTANCTNKILTFTSVYNLGMVIDGDTIFSMTPAPTFYAGNGFTFEYDGASNFTVTGDFDVVSILSSTNFLFDVCLECDGALGLPQVQQQSANEYTVFPNPTNGKFTLVSSSDAPVQCVLLNSKGQVITSILDAGNTTTFDLENDENGIYFLKIVESSGNVIVEKIIRN